MAVGIYEGNLVARGESGRGGEALGFALGDGKHLCDAATLVVLARCGFECDGVAARGFYFINPAILGRAVGKAQVIAGGKFRGFRAGLVGAVGSRPARGRADRSR